MEVNMSNKQNDYESLKPITINPGAEVTGDDFFGRENELSYLRDILSTTSSSVIIPGPRRWGKSSFVKEFGESNSEDFNFIYMHLHHCQSIETFYNYFLDRIKSNNPQAFLLKSERGLKKITNTITGLIKKIGFEGLEIEPGKIDQKGSVELFNSMGKIIKQFPKKNIILVLDEISDFLIDVRKNSGEDDAKNLLKWLRTLRQEFKVQMILTGSINIVWALKELRSEAMVGDMRTLPLEPMDEDNSIVFFKSLLKSKNIKVKSEALSFCEDKIKDGIHYFIQVFADEINKNCSEGDIIQDKSKIESVYISFLESDMPAFSNFNTRLSEYLSAAQEKAARKILAYTAYSPKDFDDLFALTGSFFSDDKLKLHNLLRRLCDEGYLIEKDSEFSFISVFLAEYWQKHYYFER